MSQQAIITARFGLTAVS